MKANNDKKKKKKKMFKEVNAVSSLFKPICA